MSCAQPLVGQGDGLLSPIPEVHLGGCRPSSYQDQGERVGENMIPVLQYGHCKGVPGLKPGSQPLSGSKFGDANKGTFVKESGFPENPVCE